MIEKIKVDTFVGTYSKFNSDGAKESYFRTNLNITPYVSFALKCKITREIVKANCLDQDGNLKINSQNRLFSHIIAILSIYTNLELSNDVTQQILEYDRLKSLGILDKIMNRIPPSEIEEFNLLEKLAFEDLLNNKSSVQNYIRGLVVTFAKTTNTGIEKLAGAIEKIDSKKLSKYVDKTVNTVIKSKDALLK